MDNAFSALLALIVLALVPWPFVDLWLSAKGGMQWFLQAKSPSKPLKFARLTYVAMLVAVPTAIAVSSTLLLGAGVALLFAHLGCLIWLAERRR